MTEHLQQAFAALDTQDDRQHALRSLIRSMNFAEKQYLLSALSSQNDPLFVFPIELVLQIFSQLHPLYTWTLQRVSKRWEGVLSSDELVRLALVRRDTHDEADSARSSLQTGPVSMRDRVRHMKALFTGQSISEMRIYDAGIKVPNFSHWFHTRLVALKGSRIAYITSQSIDGDTLVVRDVVSGKQKALRGNARERISNMILTSALVAWNSFDGFLYVSRHEQAGSEVERFQMPGFVHQGKAGHGEVVAFSTSLDPGGRDSVLRVIIYDARHGSMHSFEKRDVHRWSEHRSWKTWTHSLLIDSERRIVDIFLLLADKTAGQQLSRRDMGVGHLRFSFRGDLIHRNAAVLFPVPHDPLRGIALLGTDLKMPDPAATGRLGEYRITAWTGSNAKTGDEYPQLHFNGLFDQGSGTFVESIPIAANAHLKSEDALWKGRSHRLDPLEDWHPYAFYMNDTFLVAMETHQKGGGRIRVLCFDPSVEMAQPGNGEKSHASSETSDGH